jgi:hypothetical protein
MHRVCVLQLLDTLRLGGAERVALDLAHHVWPVGHLDMPREYIDATFQGWYDNTFSDRRLSDAACCVDGW